jgi:TrpR-related protein YerC/YecD
MPPITHHSSLITHHSSPITFHYDKTLTQKPASRKIFFMARRAFTERGWRQHPWFRRLCRSLAACGDAREVADLLRDIGTLSELQAWSERLEVARRIARGETYREIMRHTGASTTTVTRVARFLDSREGGYRRALKPR